MEKSYILLSLFFSQVGTDLPTATVVVCEIVMKHNMLENMFKYYLNALIEKKNILRFNVFAE